jgi:hypothetical protein
LLLSDRCIGLGSFVNVFTCFTGFTGFFIDLTGLLLKKFLILCKFSDFSLDLNEKTGFEGEIVLDKDLIGIEFKVLRFVGESEAFALHRGLSMLSTMPKFSDCEKPKVFSDIFVSFLGSYKDLSKISTEYLFL